MTGYEERQDIARILREYTVQDLRYSDPICELVCSLEIDCIGFGSCGGSDMMPECVKLVFDRLADLIEPSSDALLETADENAAEYADAETMQDERDYRHQARVGNVVLESNNGYALLDAMLEMGA